MYRTASMGSWVGPAVMRRDRGGVGDAELREVVGSGAITVSGARRVDLVLGGPARASRIREVLGPCAGAGDRRSRGAAVFGRIGPLGAAKRAGEKIKRG